MSDKLLTENELRMLERNLPTPVAIDRLIADHRRLTEAIHLLAATLNGELVACPICGFNVRVTSDHAPGCICVEVANGK